MIAQLWATFSSVFLAGSWQYHGSLHLPFSIHLVLSGRSETTHLLLVNLIVNLVKYLQITCFLSSLRTVEDFDNWTHWLVNRGGVGVNPNDSWESWWIQGQV